MKLNNHHNPQLKEEEVPEEVSAAEVVAETEVAAAVEEVAPQEEVQDKTTRTGLP